MIIETRSLLLSTLVALWGSVTSRLRAVSVGYRGELLFLNFYYDGVITDDDREFVSCAETEITADYPWREDDPLQVEWSAVRVDYPQPIPWQDMLVYHRYESNFRLAWEPFPYPRLNSLQLNRLDAQLVTFRALMGAILPELRLVFVFPENGLIKLYFYYHGAISELAQELARQTANFVAQQIDDGTRSDLVELHVERLDYSIRPPIETWCVYSRYEPLPPEEREMVT